MKHTHRALLQLLGLQSKSKSTRKSTTSLLILPNELLLMVASHLATLHDLLSFLLCNGQLYHLLHSTLLRRGAISPICSKRGRTVLHWAAMNRDLELMRYFLTHGGTNHINSVDYDCEAPLFTAYAFNVKADMARLMLEHGARATCRGWFNKCSLVQVAKMKGDAEFERVLEMHGVVWEGEVVRCRSLEVILWVVKALEWLKVRLQKKKGKGKGGAENIVEGAVEIGGKIQGRDPEQLAFDMGA